MKKVLLFSLVALSSVLSFEGLKNIEVKAESEYLAFSSANFEVKNSNIELEESTSIKFDCSYQGENYAWIQTKNVYSNFHIQFKENWLWEKGPNNEDWSTEPWLGKSGIILNQKADSDTLDGFFFTTYEWGYQLCSAFGNYYNGTFYSLNGGMDNYFVNQGFDVHTYDIYVQDGCANFLIDNWLIYQMALPYNESGKIAFVSNAETVCYKDLIIEDLPEGYDIASKLERANWDGYNMLGGMMYSYDAGLDQTFKMEVPAKANKYYLARRTKFTDNNQTVDVYIDPTATNNFEGKKATTWGDSTLTNYGSIFGLNMVELDASLFSGASGKVSILIDKNIAGWYSASCYWLLYEDENGVLRVADYLDLAYDFDKENHDFTGNYTNLNDFGYHFIRKEHDMIVSYIKGKEVKFTGQPTLTKIKDIDLEFDWDEENTTIDLSDYIKVDTKHKGATLTYELDGEVVSEIKFPLVSKEGKIKVSLIADGSSNDSSGNITFTPCEVEINYKITVKEAPKYKVNIKNGEDVIYSDELTNLTTLDLSAYTCSKEHYILVGWTDGTKRYSTKEKITIEKDISLTPIFEAEVYVVTLKVGDTTFEEVEVTYGEDVTLPSNVPTKDEDEEYTYEFEGWYNGEELLTSTSKISADCEYSAKFKATKKENKTSDISSEPAKEDSSSKTSEQKEEPEEKKGCGGAAIPSMLGLLALAGALISKKRK